MILHIHAQWPLFCAQLIPVFNFLIVSFLIHPGTQHLSFSYLVYQWLIHRDLIRSKSKYYYFILYDPEGGR